MAGTDGGRFWRWVDNGGQWNGDEGKKRKMEGDGDMARRKKLRRKEGKETR